MNFDQIKKHVTHFSEQIRLSSEHLDYVTIAGKIMNVIPPTSNRENDLSYNYILELDDKVGTIFVYVSPEMKNNYEILNKNEYVIIKGLVNVINRDLNNSVTRDYSVFGYEAKSLEVEVIA